MSDELPPLNGPEPRIVSGMFLAFKLDKRYKSESLGYVRSVRRAKRWSTAMIVVNDPPPQNPHGPWASATYSIRFPGHVVREPFRVVTGRDLKAVTDG